MQRAKDAIELLSRRGVLVVSVDKFPLPRALEHFEWNPKRGMVYIPAAVPSFACLIREVRDDGKERWYLAARTLIPSADWLIENRRFLEADAHYLKVRVGRVCYETRGRRRKEETEGASTAWRAGRRP
jgi:hypothetical protein